MRTNRRRITIGVSILFVTVAIAGYFFLPFSAPRRAPFTAVQWKDSTPVVRVNGQWYELIAIDSLEAERIVSFCTDTYGPSWWQKRFSEDLVEVLRRMGHWPRATVDLKVKSLESGEITILRNSPMTEANRLRVWHWNAEEGRHLTVQQIALDLNDLEVAITRFYSYAKLTGVNYGAELERIAGLFKNGGTRRAVADEVSRLLALFGDGHTRIEESFSESSYIPFLVADAREGLVAFQEDRSNFLDPQFPYLRRIDGVEIERWIDAASELVTQGSPQLVRWQAIRRLRRIQELRFQLGLPLRPSLEIELSSADGERTTKRLAQLADRRPLYGEWPRTETKLLDGNIGYLRIPRMSAREVEVRSHVDAMSGFENTRGLVIDVRGNGGGSRDVLRALFPFFMDPDREPYVANVAAYRLPPYEERDKPEGYLDNRYLYPVTSAGWDETERRAIQDFSASFDPEWTLPANEFSAWHYLVLSPSRDAPYYHYDRPIAVLMDTGCFSATDIFLGAFKGWNNVTLIGTPSGGGSGRSRPRMLSESEIEYRISSMASFRPNGKLYEARGIHPEVLVQPAATDFIGRTDTVLEEALHIITSALRQ